MSVRRTPSWVSDVPRIQTRLPDPEEYLRFLQIHCKPSPQSSVQMTTYDIPKTARAAVIKQFKQDVVLENSYPVPSPADLKPGECLVKISYAGVCHSDLHVKDNDWGFPSPLPLVGGHEGIGTVVAIGEHTVDSPVKLGDRVGLKWVARSCLKCCPMTVTHANGCSVNGTWADYVVGWTDYVQPIPESLDSAAATPILCAGITVYKAIKQSNANIGDWIAISGAGGGLGHLAVQYAVAMGLRVIAIDTGESKRKLCIDQLGAEKWVDFMESKDVVKDVTEAAGGLGPHAAVIAVGNAIPFNEALLYLRAAGTLVACLNIVGSSTGNRQEMTEALDIVAQGKVKCHFEVREWDEVNRHVRRKDHRKSGIEIGGSQTRDLIASDELTNRRAEIMDKTEDALGNESDQL
ncbi:hypothetical protein D9758_010943 [Tetrapyrgos nigripes]|uniref:alcohol dehydrogenase n=1 Tax=Tetrapyrgos nigripes TaxID=182062 RepID=A0A8H5CUY7_9AGAR|nr:hypothetical protein D9758_010943 [Tetrapyrgos nigripes]